MIKSLMTFLVLFAILTAKTCEAQPQSKIDTLCFSVPDVQRLVTFKKQVPVLIERLALKDSEINLLRQSEASLKAKDENNKGIIRTFTLQDSIRQQQNAGLLDQVAALNRSLRRSQNGKKWIAAGSIAAIVGAFFLGMKL